MKSIRYGNGLTLLLKKMPGAKKAMIMVGVKVGGNNENDRLDGASHFTEHLLFKSNRHRTAQQIVEDLEYDGSDINAFTSHGCTVFHVKALPDKVVNALTIICQATTNFGYKTEEFEKERKVILTELQRSLDDPDNYAVRHLHIPVLFRGTPLVRTVVGTRKAMSEATKDELQDFKRQYYSPNNMVIVVAGNFDQNEVFEAVDRLFGGLKQSSILESPVAGIMNERFEKIEKRENLGLAHLAIGYRVPGMASNDFLKLQLLDYILGGGMAARLFGELREKRGIGYSVGSYLFDCGLSGKVGALVTFAAGFDPQRFGETKQAILNIFEDLKNRPVSPRELERAKNLMISGYYDKISSPYYVADEMMDREFSGLSAREDDSWQEAVRRLDAEDMLKLAKIYLTDQFTLTALVPEHFSI